MSRHKTVNTVIAVVFAIPLLLSVLGVFSLGTVATSLLAFVVLAAMLDLFVFGKPRARARRHG